MIRLSDPVGQTSVERRTDGLWCWADFSPCRTWRYILGRTWEPNLTDQASSKGICMFIGLNPSTADETEDDATIRRCIRFARDWGYNGLLMTNLYAFRSTNPKHLLAMPDPVGPQNDHWLHNSAEQAAIVIAAWGTKAERRRVRQVMSLLPKPLHALKETKQRCPEHPLYVPAATQPKPWPSLDV
jgi:hypothetical protein